MMDCIQGYHVFQTVDSILVQLVWKVSVAKLLHDRAHRCRALAECNTCYCCEKAEEKSRNEKYLVQVFLWATGEVGRL